MAESAQRLLLPPVSAPTVGVEVESDYHTPQVASFKASLLWSGDRRFEAETYLASGYGLRLAIEAQPQGWARFDSLARVWQPSRLKGTQVGPKYGTPFLAATQVFDLRPVPRKWLAVEQIAAPKMLYVEDGQILVTRSGTVGRATLAHAPHENTLISDDLLRVEARDDAQRGWIYAYLRSPQARSMMSGLQYGHMIKHLETGHMKALPIPIVSAAHAADFAARVQQILDARNEGHRLAMEAEKRFELALGIEELADFEIEDTGENGYSISAAKLFCGRRRFEGSVHNPAIAAIRRFLTERGQGFSRLDEAGFDVWLPNRFKRIAAENGMDLVGSAQLFEINPDFEKQILDGDFGDRNRGRAEKGWLLMSRSGQTYGILGSIVLAGEALQNKIISDHVLRICPRAEATMRAGYVQVALSHAVLGRPLVKAMAYGSSIPSIEPDDAAIFPVVRLSDADENAIADLAEASAASRSKADVLERALSADAGVLLARFIAGEMSDFQLS